MTNQQDNLNRIGNAIRMIETWLPEKYSPNERTAKAKVIVKSMMANSLDKIPTHHANYYRKQAAQIIGGQVETDTIAKQTTQGPGPSYPESQGPDAPYNKPKSDLSAYETTPECKSRVLKYMPTATDDQISRICAVIDFGTSPTGLSSGKLRNEFIYKLVSKGHSLAAARAKAAELFPSPINESGGTITKTVAHAKGGGSSKLVTKLPPNGPIRQASTIPYWAYAINADVDSPKLGSENTNIKSASDLSAAQNYFEQTCHGDASKVLTDSRNRKEAIREERIKSASKKTYDDSVPSWAIALDSVVGQV